MGWRIVMQQEAIALDEPDAAILSLVPIIYGLYHDFFIFANETFLVTFVQSTAYFSFCLMVVLIAHRIQ